VRILSRKDMEKCKVCGNDTLVYFNINLEATPICENCARAIFLQQAMWYVESEGKELKKGLNE